MDPTACLARILDSIREGDRDETVAALLDLAEWLEGGGFMPDLAGPAGPIRYPVAPKPLG